MQSVSSQGGEISSSELGVSLVIPPKAVPPGKTVTVRIWPCLSGPFISPDGYEFTSPVYLISPVFTFEKEVQLSLQHFASLTSDSECDRMVFMSASTSPSFRESNPEYHFHVFKRGHFTKDSSTATLSLKHFCQLATGRKRRREDGEAQAGSPKKSKGIHFDDIVSCIFEQVVTAYLPPSYI